MTLMLSQIFGLGAAGQRTKLTSSLGLQQTVSELAHIIGDFSSCIDLIFTSQPNLVMESEELMLNSI